MWIHYNDFPSFYGEHNDETDFFQLDKQPENEFYLKKNISFNFLGRKSSWWVLVFPLKKSVQNQLWQGDIVCFAFCRPWGFD